MCLFELESLIGLGTYLELRKQHPVNRVYYTIAALYVRDDNIGRTVACVYNFSTAAYA